MNNDYRFLLIELANYLKKLSSLASENDNLVSATAIVITGAINLTLDLLDIGDPFGISTGLLIMVLSTVFADMIFGIIHSNRRADKYLRIAKRLDKQSEKYKEVADLYQDNTFNSKKLVFTFFKIFVFLAYLVFAKMLLDDSDESGVFEFTASILIKTPVAIFWYHEFKSIGNHSEVIFGKKASMFKIAELLFEPKIAKLFKKDSNELDEFNRGRNEEEVNQNK